MDGFEGRIVMVTGAGGALGAGLVEAFVGAGADVVAVSRSQPTDRINGVRYEQADVGVDGDVARLFDRIGVPWAVVNTVGGFAGHRPFPELDVDEVNRQLALNLITAAVVTKHALRLMGSVGEGRLIHTASRAATSTDGSGFAYSVSKAGVLHLVRMASAEVVGSGITVNAVSPSIIDTPANRAAMPDADHASWPKIAELAKAYLFLASPASSLVNGAALPV